MENKPYFGPKCYCGIILPKMLANIQLAGERKFMIKHINPKYIGQISIKGKKYNRFINN